MYSASEVLDLVHNALESTNRYYASLHLGREATVEEAVRHYLMYNPPPVHIKEFVVSPLTGEDDAPLFV